MQFCQMVLPGHQGTAAVPFQMPRNPYILTYRALFETKRCDVDSRVNTYIICRLKDRNSDEMFVPPNLETPLVWLPPVDAAQVQAANYVFVAVLGAWTWDFLMSLSHEYKLFFKCKFQLPQAIYVLSRICTFWVIALSFLIGNLNIRNCDAVFIAVGLAGSLATLTNSLLMAFRVRAVYHGSKVMVAFFSLLWLATAAASLLGAFALKGVHIGPTQICTTSEVASFSSATFIAAGIYDTIVFLAITYRMVTYHTDVSTNSWTHHLKTIFSGEGMGNISRILLQTGVLYYLATIGMNMATMICTLVPSLSPAYRVIFAVPNVALMNAMACRVFRQVRLGLLIDYPSSTASGTHMVFAPAILRVHAREDIIGVRNGLPKETASSGMCSDADVSVI